MFISVRRNNWPPLPEILPLQPCFYQDINVDIPVEFQRIVRHLYYLWIIHAMVLLVNTLVLFLRIFIKHDPESFMTFGMSLIYIVIFIPVSFICWFRPAYKAFRYVLVINTIQNTGNSAIVSILLWTKFICSSFWNKIIWWTIVCFTEAIAPSTLWYSSSFSFSNSSRLFYWAQLWLDHGKFIIDWFNTVQLNC